ncbi:MAG: 2-C-methyl-D-erythritol 2,4-cyclodiphosphate synthase [Spirochaetales bacterium]|nr:2-C-methyl-D-erythritol 2,4-cyclodiphosphate synthase [Spirochaetales bacterium]
MRIGQGWDLHRLIEGRKLIIAGVHVPFHMGEEAHSDGDVLVHAIIDALLGAAAMDDIGVLFPPSDMRWKDSDSRENLRYVMTLIKEAGYRVINLDTTVVLEKPKLGPHRPAIRENLAEDLGVPIGSVSFKAKTSERVNAVGEGRAIEAQAAVLLEEINK